MSQEKPKDTLFKPGNQLARTPLNTGKPVEWTDDKCLEEAKALEEWIANPNSYYIGEFCVLRGYHHQTLDVLCARNSVFAETLKKAKQAQESRIVANSLTRKFDGNFAKFVLANRAGWKEKTEVSGDANNPLSFLLNQIDGKTKDVLDVEVESIKPKELDHDK